jgi:predicted DNA-binding transcriptional regulator AlpA
MNATDDQKRDIGTGLQLLPRLIRLRDAPGYLGMDRNKFNREVRPALTEIPLGKQSVAFDRLELDAWVDEYKSRNGRPGQSTGERLWDARGHRASSSGRGSGTLTRSCTDSELSNLLAQATSTKRKGTSRTG